MEKWLWLKMQTHLTLLVLCIYKFYQRGISLETKNVAYLILF